MPTYRSGSGIEVEGKSSEGAKKKEREKKKKLRSNGAKPTEGRRKGVRRNKLGWERVR